MFDTKLNWKAQVQKTILKASKALNGIKLVRRYFTEKETLMLLTSNFYSILYYNSDVWLMHSLNQQCKKQLMTASSNALKVANNYRYPFSSYLALHNRAKRATPEMLTNYKLAISLFNLYNSRIQSSEWINMNFQQVFTSRQICFHVNKNNRLNVGMNALSNRLHGLNDKIKLEWLNLTYNAYKVACKKLFLN